MLSLFKNCNFYQYYAYRKDVMGGKFYKTLTNIRGLFVGLLIASNALNIGALWIKFESFLKKNSQHNHNFKAVQSEVCYIVNEYMYNKM